MADSVTIIGARYQSHPSVSQTTIGRAELDRLQPLQIDEALRVVPGLYVRDYGGVGGVKSISLRGGSSAQSLVLLDGFHWNSAQNGQMDISAIPTSFLSGIEVSRGALSALYGANALTGAVNLSVALPSKNYGRVFAEGGSFGSWRLAANGATRIDDVVLGAAIERYGSDGSYSYPISADGSEAFINRTNADVINTSAVVRAEIGVSSSIMILGRTGERGVPGAVVTNGPSSQRARFSDTDGMVQARSTLFSTSTSTVRASIGGRYLDQTFVDPESKITGPQGVDERFLLRDVIGSVSYLGTSGPVSHEATADVGYVDLRGGGLQPNVGDLVVRRHGSGSYHLQWSLATDLNLEGAVRGDWYSDIGAAASGFIGSSWNISSILTGTANVGTGFRPPSFNELYFLNYGTSSLKPERSVSATIGATVAPFSWLVWDVSVYMSEITDLIVSIPISPVITSAQNVGRAQSVGFESNMVTQLLDQDLVATWSYTLQSVLDKTGRSGIDGTPIPYVPVEMIGMTTVYDNGTVLGRAEWTYISHRYALAGGEYSSLMPSYSMIHIGGGFHVQAKDVLLDILLRLDNILDERYNVVQGFPMPGRSVRLTLRVTS